MRTSPPMPQTACSHVYCMTCAKRITADGAACAICNGPMSMEACQLLSAAKLASLGLRWEHIGTEPETGAEVADEELAKALQRKTVFTEEEWRQFDVSNLAPDSWIKVPLADQPGTVSYLRPADSDLNQLMRAVCGEAAHQRIIGAYGMFGSKLAYVIDTLLEIRRQDPAAKCLIYCQFDELSRKVMEV